MNKRHCSNTAEQQQQQQHPCYPRFAPSPLWSLTPLVSSSPVNAAINLLPSPRAMLQLEALHHYQLPVAAAGTSDGSGSSSSNRGVLSMLSESEMTHFSEFLDGCPTVSLDRASMSRSSSFADPHAYPLADGGVDSPHQNDDQRFGLAHLPPRPCMRDRAHSFALLSGSMDNILAGSDWTSPTLVSDTDALAPVPPLVPHAFVSFASDSSRDVITSTAAVPYFDPSYWTSDRCVLGFSSMPPLLSHDSADDATATTANSYGDLAPIAIDALERDLKSDPAAVSPADVSSSQSNKEPAATHAAHPDNYDIHVDSKLAVTKSGSATDAVTSRGFHTSRHQSYPQQQSHTINGDDRHLHPVDRRQHYELDRPLFPLGVNGASNCDFGRVHPFPYPRHAVVSTNCVSAPRSLSTESSQVATPTTATTHTTTTNSTNRCGNGTWTPNVLAARDSRGPPSAAAMYPQASVRTRAQTASAAIRGRSPVLTDASASMIAALAAPTASVAQSPRFPVQLTLVTALNDCYWKNGRKNLQCFPACPEHHDFYSMKMNNRKHASVGVCRGPIYCHIVTPMAASGSGSSAPKSGYTAIGSTDSVERPSRAATAAATAAARDACSAVLPTIPTSQHMKYEFGVGASSSGGSARELFVLGRFERVPQSDSSDSSDSTNLANALAAPPEFASAAAFEAFRYSCFQAVEIKDERHIVAAGPNVRSTWFFLPDVWKVQPMLKKKRKATRSMPAQTFPFCFRVFVYTAQCCSSSSDNTAHGYRCVAASASTFFELYSTRTVDRVKRKYWSATSTASGEENGGETTKRTRR